MYSLGNWVEGLAKIQVTRQSVNSLTLIGNWRLRMCDVYHIHLGIPACLFCVNVFSAFCPRRRVMCRASLTPTWVGAGWNTTTTPTSVDGWRDSTWLVTTSASPTNPCSGGEGGRGRGGGGGGGRGYTRYLSALHPLIFWGGGGGGERRVELSLSASPTNVLVGRKGGERGEDKNYIPVSASPTNL